MNNEFTYLKQLIEMVEREGDEHNKRKLWSLIGRYAQDKVGELPGKESLQLLAEVHELNLEQYVKVQAHHFYDEFPFDNIKNQLIDDFIEMEHCRRRDDFYRFCVAAYQQIENISNHLYDSFNYWQATVTQIKKEIPELSKPGQKSWVFSLCNQLVYQPNRNLFNINLVNRFIEFEPRDLKFSSKFKVVLFFGYFKDEKINIPQWKPIYDLGDKLYAARNKVHRGAIDTEKQADKLYGIEKNKYNYYLLMSGFLADFVNKISGHYIDNMTKSKL